MEGYLSKWTNYMYGWKKRYFILHAGVLHYCRDKGAQQKGAIHLDVAQIIPHSDIRRIAIDTGCTIIHLKAYNDEEGRLWRKALCTTKEDLSHENSNRELRESEPTGTIETDLQRISVISDKLGELWSIQAQLEATIDLLPNSAKLTHPMNSIVTLAHQFKYMMADTLSLLEEESVHAKEINKALEDKLISWSNGPDNIDGPMLPRAKEYQLPDEERSEIEFHDALSDSEDMFHEVTDIIERPEGAEGSFSMLTEESIPHRKCLPVLRNPKQKINIWKVVRDTIGKDLSRIAVPVYFNEPLSFLQKFTEDLSYVSLLNSASDSRDSLLRLAYVACFAVSSYTSTINRSMKPFNPVLGETFELERDGFKVLSEQVSHHPPISSIHCEHENFRFWASTEVKSSFKGTYLQIMPTGKHHIYLTKHEEEFSWDKAITNVNNIIIGQINLEHVGEIIVTNHKTGDKASVVFKKRGWFDKATSEVNGVVSDSNGIERYNLTGKWDEGMYIINSRTQEQIIAYQIYPLPEAWEHNYYFTDFALQLNLPPEFLTGLLPTDSRFRPDQRALENGDIKLSTDEKHRVEEKQRKARKELEVSRIEYRPRWFSMENGEWIYHGGFWEEKEQGMFKNISDIF